MKTFITVCVLQFTICQAFACWMAPADYETVAENGKYKVTVTAPDNKNTIKSQVSAFEKNGDEWTKNWTIAAINSVQPSHAHISNDGLTIITFGNWGGHDEGNDELVVYRKGQLVKQYSVDGLLGGHFKPKIHSTAGSEWLIYSFNIFHDDAQFCLWIDLIKEWIVINLESGQLIVPNEENKIKYESKIRKQSYDKIESGEDYFHHYRQVARFICPEDKLIFEKMLMRPNDNLDCGSVEGDSDFYYYISNEYRELAEMALCALDNGEKDAIRDFDRDKDYNHLGSVKISAIFEQAPRKDEGCIILWLKAIGNDNDGDNLIDKRPAHALGIDLKYSFPYGLQKANKPMKMPVQMIMYGILPGKYRILGYWRKDAKHLYDMERDFWQLTGDSIVTNSPTIEIVKGRFTEAAIMFNKNKVLNKPVTGDGK